MNPAEILKPVDVSKYLRPKTDDVGSPADDLAFLRIKIKEGWHSADRSIALINKKWRYKYMHNYQAENNNG